MFFLNFKLILQLQRLNNSHSTRITHQSHLNKAFNNVILQQMKSVNK